MRAHAAGPSRRPAAPGPGRQLTEADLRCRHRKIGAPATAVCHRVGGAPHLRSAALDARMTSRVRPAQPSQPLVGVDEQGVVHPADHIRRAPLNGVMGKRSRNASMGQTGASELGSIPGCQPHGATLVMTSGSCAMIVIGTSRLAPGPLTTAAGWWSPTATTTRLSSAKVSTNEMRVLIEY